MILENSNYIYPSFDWYVTIVMHLITFLTLQDHVLCVCIVRSIHILTTFGGFVFHCFLHLRSPIWDQFCWQYIFYLFFFWQYIF